MNFTHNHIRLYRSLFKGREDVFAIHWSKGLKSSYMPAYEYDPYLYKQHRFKGGSFKDFKEKRYEPFTDDQLLKHVNGEQLIGIYPLLQDNTSWFIAADFDKENWFEECQQFIKICEEYRINAYLERSRSGNGGHVWIFFERAYPAIKSRMIFKKLLEQSGTFSVFDKTSSFDRLFPNQDYHSGKGLGNLIALPLHRIFSVNSNSCFIQTDLSPYPDQWQYLENIKRVSILSLDKIHTALNQESITSEAKAPASFSNKLQIKLDNVITLNRSALTVELINFLKEELNVQNSDYYVKKQMGKNTWGVQRYFKFIEEKEHEVQLPRGIIGKLIRYCTEIDLEYEFNDKRKKYDAVSFKANFTLKGHQNKVLAAVQKKDFGVITSPPGSGKTIIALKIIEDKQQPALIIVHRKQLLDQWNERIEAFLGIPKKDIGKIGSGKAKVGKSITIAMIQSLGKFLENSELDHTHIQFGTIIIDECHHIPAETYRKSIAKLTPYYQYGLTATPFRKGNDVKLIFAHIGEQIIEIKPDQVESFKRARIIVHKTSFNVPYNSKTDSFETLSKMLIHDSERNKLILTGISEEISTGRKVIVITERKEHIETLHQFLKQSYEVITLSGEDNEANRKAKWKTINAGNYQALITTGQYFGEGVDLQKASCLFLVYPFSFKGKLIQYIGRVQRSELTPRIHDFHDHKIEYLHKLFLKRNTYYRNLDRQASLFGDPEDNVMSIKDTFEFSKQVKVAIEDLEFRYGSVAFSYEIPTIKRTLEFEVENDNIRPEFDVLKPFFSKFLKSKYVRIDLTTEFEKSILVAQLATSSDLDSINREVLESVKFKFIEKKYTGLQYEKETDNSLLNLDQLQKENGFHTSEEELLDGLLKNKAFKHHHQLRYLASKHEGTILKLRFVLSPFSFVFLLAGENQYHIILETLDTEEATYIWHLEKSKGLLRMKLKAIDEDLNVIRNKGRQVFLANDPISFSRIHHDYSDDRKGFIVWKDLLEERLV